MHVFLFLPPSLTTPQVCAALATLYQHAREHGHCTQSMVLRTLRKHQVPEEAAMAAWQEWDVLRMVQGHWHVSVRAVRRHHYVLSHDNMRLLGWVRPLDKEARAALIAADAEMVPILVH